ncbi:AraC family transcriptional regulator [Actomonas aquatica]|uniref:AraC family transcriptional regulator n=1 Tax=Actomonas aquatica TaxID=2866162 RepID=A0ABZ1C7H4_9BACT|nr:AraC family transcriptional regulator [Opitutus sp. WL0086]WRQ87456.1 AraC family transcriptional regulator [Opitutus sp. WL0086]
MIQTTPALDQIRRALAAIEAHLDRPLAMAELARRAGYSTWHFQRVFLALVDEPVASYVRRRRLTEAARMLRHEPEQRLLEVALAVGFESHEAFTRAFRRESGHTPSGFRDHPQPNLSWMRLPVAAEHLQLLPTNMSFEPTLLDLPALTLVGLSDRFIAAMSPDATNMDVIPPLWRSFQQRCGEIHRAYVVREPNQAWGVCRCLPPTDRTREDELEYLAGVQIDPEAHGDLPEGMVRWDVPARRYARFTHRGPIETFPETLSYVWGAWFPRSEYEPAMEAELELYDERFKPGAEDSVLDYYVALRNKA